MESNSDLSQALKDIKKVADNKSWFRDTPHYWATASLSIAYAVACVEVVSNTSDKAGAIYQRIIEAWANPGLKTLRDAIISEVTWPAPQKVRVLSSTQSILYNPYNSNLVTVGRSWNRDELAEYIAQSKE